MPPKIRYSFWLDADLDAALKRLKARDGVPESEFIRRALRAALLKAGVLKRGGTHGPAT